MRKALLIFAIIILGAIFTIGSEWKFLIRPNLMAMLFFSFLSIQLDRSMIRAAHFKVVALNIILPVAFYFALLPFDRSIALTAFIVSFIPTAVAAPILAQIMNRNVALVTFSVILTTPVIALTTPLLLLFVLDISSEFSMIDLILPILSLIGIPLVSSQIIRWLASTKVKQSLSKLGVITFPLFLLNLFIACGDASLFLRQNTALSIYLIWGIFAITVVVSITQFQLGRLLGRKEESVEFSLSLGRKNTMLGIWLALTYFEPYVVIGPVCYILVQNIYNSFEIWYLDRRVKTNN